jgi:hypothetical protein
MKPKLCLLLTIACLLLLLGLFRLGLEGGQEAVASTLRESGMTRSAWAHNYKLTNAPALTATYVFNLDGTPVNDTVSARFFGLNLIWPFMQFDAGSRQVLDPEVKATLTELGPANFYRFPGGQWSEWYLWYWGIGPQEERPWAAIPPARQPLPNTFGTIEFLETMKGYGATDAMFTVNYLSGSPIVAHAWIEFVNGPAPAEGVADSWTTDCWGDTTIEECWRYKRELTVTRAITTGANTVAVSPADLAELDLYLDPGQFDPDAANCDEISIDGYGQNGCLDQNLYEHKKLSLNINDEWMIIERVDGTTLTVRRADEARREHPPGSNAYYWDYSGLENAPAGYFAWLRSQPGFGGQEEPYNILYWELGNEPFWAVVDGDLDGFEECNYWFPCVQPKSSPDEAIRIESYIQFYNQVAALEGLDIKFGLDLRDYVHVSDMAGDFEALDCPAILQQWNRATLDGIVKEKVDFVAPHFYVVSEGGEDFALVTHPDRFFAVFEQLAVCLEDEFDTPPEIVANEFGLFYHEDRAYGWFSELSDEAGRWRDGLFLATLLARFMQLDNITGANYWNLIWPGFLGRPGLEVYPYADQFYVQDFTQSGPIRDLYGRLIPNTFNKYFAPSLQHTPKLTVEVTGDGLTKVLEVDPLLVYATRSSSNADEYSLVAINRSAVSVPLSVTLRCGTCIGEGEVLSRVELYGSDYQSEQIQVEERLITEDTADLAIVPGMLAWREVIPPLSVVILAVPSQVSGRVTDAGGYPMADVMVSAGPGLSATTGADGSYGIPHVAAGLHTLVPSKRGYLFAPQERTVSLPPDAVGQDFVSRPAPVSTTLALSGTASLSATLSYTDTQGLTTTLYFPSGAVTNTTTLLLTPTTTFGPSGWRSANHAFELVAYQGDEPLPGFGFQKAVTITIKYSERDTQVVTDEGQLVLWRWTGVGWEDAASTCTPPSAYRRDPGLGIVSLPICHLSRFSLFGPTRQTNLPLVLLGD